MFRIALTEAGAPRDELLSREWLDTNGTGGYASSTLLNCHTRRYHGLLVANLAVPPGRYVLLSTVEDSLSLQGTEYFFSCHQYPRYFFPPDTAHFAEFRQDLSPVFTFAAEEFRLQKAVMMVHGKDCVLIRYDVERCPVQAMLRLKPFFAYRGYHDLARENAFVRMQTAPTDRGFTIAPYDGMPALCFAANTKGKFAPFAAWYRNFERTVERRRGFDWQEDLFCPGVLEIPVKEGSCVVIAASLEHPVPQPKRAWRSEEIRRRREEERDRAATEDLPEEDAETMRHLYRAASHFPVVIPADRPAVIAGYHWFGDWGRDTLIALPGLTFRRGRIREGIEVLVSLAAHERNGLLPNYFAEDGHGHVYNSVDGPLWFFWTVQQMLLATEAYDIVEHKLWPVMKRIIAAFTAGTSFDIHVNNRGLLHAGNGGPALTWMDAAVQGLPVTPRWGYPVEINALWYNALCLARTLAKRFDEDASPYSLLAARLRLSFQDTFWIRDEEYLGDVFHNGFLDRTVRPNQILAVSLPSSPLDPPQWVGVVRKCADELLTPCGLRTLSPYDVGYWGKYEDDAIARDRSYHQGTVWPWLLDHFGEAYLQVSPDKAAARTFLQEHLRAFLRRHLGEAGIGTVSEIFDGDPPHHPDGCIAQAWSVGGLIRLSYLLRNAARPEKP